MMRALGLDARMSSDRLAATARRYADLMAASREGHVMAASDAAAGGGSGDGRPASGDKRKRHAEDRPDAKDATDGSFEMVVERDLELATMCEHHLLPFHGAVHVAYLRPASGGSGSASGSGPPRGAAALVTKHGRRFQVQERLTRDIARTFAPRPERGGDGRRARVAPVHDRTGVEKPGSTTCTSRVSAPSREAREEARLERARGRARFGGEEGRR